MDQGIFSLITLVVVIVVIVAFVVFTVLQYNKDKKAKDNLKFPPFPSKCPDYWTNMGDSKCKNEHNIGLCKKYNGNKDSNVMDFGDDLFKGEKGMFYKCSWARKCKAPWEGIDKLCI